MWRTRRTIKYGLLVALAFVGGVLVLLFAAYAEDDQSATTAPSDQLPLLPQDEAQPIPDADPLAGGVTAVAPAGDVTSPPTAEPAPPDSAPPTATAEGQPQPITFSNRFLLGNRQDQLSLGSKESGRHKAKPAKAKPAKKPAKPQAASSKPAKPAASALPPSTDNAESTGSSSSEWTPPAPSGPALPTDQELPASGLAGSQTSSLEDYFAESDAGQDSVVAEPSTPATPALSETPTAPVERPVSVIATRPPQIGSPSKPTLGDALDHQGRGTLLGSGLSGFSPMRSLAIMLAMVAVLLAGYWFIRKWKVPSFRMNQGSLAVMETITLSPGRQIVIVEMRDEALVLGMTPHSINLLDKVPLEDFGESYRKTVNMIIKREDKALPDDWSRQPRFAAEPAIPRLSSSKPSYTYGPSGRLRTSVAELRRARASLRRPSSGVLGQEQLAARGPHGRVATKTELINRARQQLTRLGE